MTKYETGKEATDCGSDDARLQRTINIDTMEKCVFGWH